MEVIIGVLLLALVVTFGWALRLRQNQQRLPIPEPQAPQDVSPGANPQKPLFDAATAAIDAGLLIVDSERSIRYFNKQAAEMIAGIGVLEVGQGLIGAIREYQVDTLAAEVLADGEGRELVLNQLASGRMLQLRATRFSDGDSYGLTVLIRDVTQLSMLERARRDLVANVSHELRTPLTSVKLLVETLQSEPPAPIARRMLGQMAQEVDAITQLVDELHQLSQIEAGRVTLHLRPTMLDTVITRAIERIQPQAERKSLTLVAVLPSDLPEVLIDPDRVGQVLLNLLHNAAKFTAEGGQISVRAMPVAVGGNPALSDGVVLPVGHQQGNWALVQVQDSGVGIPAQELHRIFERFYKVDRARTRNAGGTGLGLAIAKHLVEGHGGRIWATSREGHGSIFWFTLPLNLLQPE